jgi:hypothetical protein
MNEDAEKVIDALYMAIRDNITDEICHDCPIVQTIGDLKDTIHNYNTKIVIEQLGIEIEKCKCPCMKKHTEN